MKLLILLICALFAVSTVAANGLEKDCLVAVEEAQKYLENDENAPEIEEFLEKRLCKILPKLDGVCSLFVGQFFPQILELIRNSTKNSAETCEKIAETFPF
ncbi:unnamed protein product [Caenorhabditis angaria]|uniref:Saposin B-type domain-containing protein n=1 Tax=Caenorhabditis angaria TaxID=860376 RepID=A0A9P1ICU3_9PELO|nr:unnamed protein product [Caenorhabditis angaria]